MIRQAKMSPSESEEQLVSAEQKPHSERDTVEALRLARLIVEGDVDAWCDQDSDKLAAHALLRLEEQYEHLDGALRGRVAQLNEADTETARLKEQLETAEKRLAICVDTQKANQEVYWDQTEYERKLNAELKEQKEALEAALQKIADNREIVQGAEGHPSMVYGGIDMRKVAAEALAAVRNPAKERDA